MRSLFFVTMVVPFIVVGLHAGCSSDEPGASGATTPPDAGTNAEPTDSGGATGEPTCDPSSGTPTWKMAAPALTPEFVGDLKALDAQVAGVSGVAYGNGIWVIMGGNVNQSTIHWATSTDGTTWSPRSQTVAEGGKLSGGGVRWDGKRFLMFASVAGAGGFVYESADGMTWKSHQVAKPIEAATFGEFDFSDSAIVITGGGGYMASAPLDLSTWTRRSNTGSTYRSIAFGAGRWVATVSGGSKMYVAGDDVVWSPSAMPDPAGGTVVFGRGVFLWTNTAAKFYSSTDGMTFAPLTRTGSWAGKDHGGRPTFAGDRFVLTAPKAGAPGQTLIGASVDGKEWTDFGTESAGIPEAHDIAATGLKDMAVTSIAYGGCRYVIAGTYKKARVSDAGAPDAGSDAGAPDPGAADALFPFIITSTPAK